MIIIRKTRLSSEHAVAGEQWDEAVARIVVWNELYENTLEMRLCEVYNNRRQRHYIWRRGWFAIVYPSIVIISPYLRNSTHCDYMMADFTTVPQVAPFVPDSDPTSVSQRWKRWSDRFDLLWTSLTTRGRKHYCYTCHKCWFCLACRSSRRPNYLWTVFS